MLIDHWPENGPSHVSAGDVRHAGHEDEPIGRQLLPIAPRPEREGLDGSRAETCVPVGRGDIAA